MRRIAIAATSEAERIEKLGAYFRDFLTGWLAQLVAGVEPSPGVQRELTMALLEHAAISLIATSESAAQEDDDKTVERCERAARAAFAVLEKEIVS